MKLFRASRQFLAAARAILVVVALMTPLLHAQHLYSIPGVSPSSDDNYSIPGASDAATAAAVCNGNCSHSPTTGVDRASYVIPGAQPQMAEEEDEDDEEEEHASTMRGSCRLLAAAKYTVRRVYGNRNVFGGYCGTGVGRSIRAAGFPLTFGGLDAINYDKHVLTNPRWVGNQQWTKLNIQPDFRGARTWQEIDRRNKEAIAKAPPGAVLVFAGPCTPGNYPKPMGRFGCNGPVGNRVGHVTIKGDDGWFYTDGRTKEPTVPNRYLVGVWLPPGAENESCHPQERPTS